MGKKIKKREKGAVSNYITRNQAVKKLQISLAQFRRLCILKGIYPREPKNKKKVGKGSTAPRTYYYRKDIQFLLHEPVLFKLREQKIFAKKLSKAIAKREWAQAKNLEETRPEYSLDHIIRERYPTFIDALRDVDDALSMAFLFATLPATDKIKGEHVRKCQTLCAEFQHYVMISRSLKKVFLSIKGIYYQAEIKGQEITWIVPYQFSQHVPTDVDFRVMTTFLELYETLLGFVNFKLYSDLNLVYPPKIDEEKDAGAAGLAAFRIETTDGRDLLSSLEPKPSARVAKSQKQQTEKRLATLGDKIAEINDDMEDDEADAEIADAGVEDDAVTDLPEPSVAPTTMEETVPTLQSYLALHTDLTAFQNIFKGCVFYLSREVPRYSLEFVLKAFGAQVGWDATSGSGSPLLESDTRITHHIVDRPLVEGQVRYERREYLQPQWVYDCINARRLVKTAGYHIGEQLPPHLSPFVKFTDDAYVPQEALALQQDDAMEVDATEDAAAEGTDDEEEEVPEDSEDELPDDLAKDSEDEEEALHAAELAAEAAGISFSEYLAQQQESGKTAGKRKRTKPSPEEEQRELAKMMMSKKDRHLLNKIEFGQKRKQEQVS
ncbi:Pescadillo N-terminus-domain-containing protein [Gaertneriomyces semiglobifer]|nr:Pescadillo N-terminus-domain-containing protein [Gaertneriomyces semiglobifer]